MKRIFPQNYFIMILVIGAMYGFIGYITIIETDQYFVLPILIGLTIILLNRRVCLGSNGIMIIQGFKLIKVNYAEIQSLFIKPYRPKLSRVSVPAIYFVKSNGEKKIFYYKMYSSESLSIVINTLTSKNRNIGVSATVKNLIKS